MEGDLKTRLTELGDRALGSIGCYVVDAQVEFGRSRSILRFFIDSISGRISIDDCAKGSRLIEAAIDQGSAFGGEYALEVSSPGMERRIARARDFERFKGKTVRVRTRTPIEGKRNFEGTIGMATGTAVQVKVGDEVKEFPYALIARANLVGEGQEREDSHGH